MRLLFSDHYRTARQSLRRAKTRTFLTIIGVAIGIGSITAVLSLSAGITELIGGQVLSLGNSLAVVRPKAPTPSLTDLTNPTATTQYTTSPIEERDLETIRDLKNVESAAPIMTISAGIRAGKTRPDNATLVATSPELKKVTGLELASGGFIDSVTNENTVVIGDQLAIDLFGTDDADGKSFSIKGQKFTVIGVLKRQNKPVNFDDINYDHAAIISFESGKLFNSNLAQIQQIDVKTKKGADMSNVKSSITKVLAANHDGERDTSVLIGDEISEPTSRLFVFINTVTSVVASISLFVGGIGIMNIMLVSVAERTREIGLRKAVGASNRMIIAQFMIEALIISLFGGLGGYVLGYLSAFIISFVLPYDPVVTWQIAAWAFGLSVVVGSVFGLYPAIRASRKDPIESLRRYH